MRLFRHPRTGYWYVEFKRGSQRSLRTKNNRLARKLFHDIKRDWLKGRLIKLDKVRRVSLDELRDELLEAKSDLSPATIRMYRLAYTSLGAVVGGKLAVRLIDRSKIDRFKRICLSRGMRPVSVNSYLRHIKAGLRFAYDEGYIDRAPIIKFLKTPQRLPRILSTSEINQILSWCNRNDLELGRMVKFALWTGCRRKEILDLRWHRIKLGKDPSARIIGKGDRERTIYLLPNAIDSMGPAADVGPVFKQWHPSTFTHRFKHAARENNVRGVKLHTLRHTAATQMLASGIRLELIQKILGHQQISTTQIYAQVLDTVMAEEMQKLTYDLNDRT